MNHLFGANIMSIYAQVDELTLINYRLNCIQAICGQIISCEYSGPIILEDAFEELLRNARCNYSKLVEILVNSPDSIECSRCLIIMAQETNREVETVISVVPPDIIQQIMYMTELIIIYCQRIMLHQNIVAQETE